MAQIAKPQSLWRQIAAVANSVRGAQRKRRTAPQRREALLQAAQQLRRLCDELTETARQLDHPPDKQTADEQVVRRHHVCAALQGAGTHYWIVDAAGGIQHLCEHGESTPDTALAAEAGCAISTIGQLRQKLGIAKYRISRPQPRLPYLLEQLATGRTQTQLAKELGVSYQRINQILCKARQAGYSMPPGVRGGWWYQLPAEFVPLLGQLPDAELARRAGCSPYRIAKQRKKAGLPPVPNQSLHLVNMPRQAKVRETRKLIKAKLATGMTQRTVASELGISESAVSRHVHTPDYQTLE